MSICVVKQTLLSLGIISSTVFMLKPTFNLLCLISIIIPSFRVWLRSWLSPLYAYITISVILILILIVTSSSSSSCTQIFVADSSPEASWTAESREQEEEMAERLVKDGGTAVIDGWEKASWTAESGKEEEERGGGIAEKLEKDEEAEVRDGRQDENESLDAAWKAIKEDDGEKRKRKAISSLRETPYLRKDDGLQSHDELNQQVELFITKFRNSMRLERLESDQRLLDLLSRGI